MKLAILTMNIATLETDTTDFGTAVGAYDGVVTATNASTNTEFYKNLKDIFTYGKEGERDEAIVDETRSTLGHVVYISTMIDLVRLEQSIELLKAEALRIRKSNYITLEDTIARAQRAMASCADA